MAKIELLAVENTLTRKKVGHQQVLHFLLAVESPDYHKQVDVIWCGHDGIWHTLSANYQGHAVGARAGSSWRTSRILAGTRYD